MQRTGRDKRSAAREMQRPGACADAIRRGTAAAVAGRSNCPPPKGGQPDPLCQLCAIARTMAAMALLSLFDGGLQAQNACTAPASGAHWNSISGKPMTGGVGAIRSRVQATFEGIDSLTRAGVCEMAEANVESGDFGDSGPWCGATGHTANWEAVYAELDRLETCRTAGGVLHSCGSKATVEQQVRCMIARHRDVTGNALARKRWESALKGVLCQSGGMTESTAQERVDNGGFNKTIWRSVKSAIAACTTTKETPDPPANSPPTIGSGWPATLTMLTGTTKFVTLSDKFIDDDGDALTYTKTQTGQTVTSGIANNALKIIATNAEGDTTIKVTASDGKASVTATLVVTVEYPVMPQVLVPTIKAGQSGLITLTNAQTVNLETWFDGGTSYECRHTAYHPTWTTAAGGCFNSTGSGSVRIDGRNLRLEAPGSGPSIYTEWTVQIRARNSDGASPHRDVKVVFDPEGALGASTCVTDNTGGTSSLPSCNLPASQYWEPCQGLELSPSRRDGILECRFTEGTDVSISLRGVPEGYARAVVARYAGVAPKDLVGTSLSSGATAYESGPVEAITGLSCGSGQHEGFGRKMAVVKITGRSSGMGIDNNIAEGWKSIELPRVATVCSGVLSSTSTGLRVRWKDDDDTTALFYTQGRDMVVKFSRPHRYIEKFQPLRPGWATGRRLGSTPIRLTVRVAGDGLIGQDYGVGFNMASIALNFSGPRGVAGYARPDREHLLRVGATWTLGGAGGGKRLKIRTAGTVTFRGTGMTAYHGLPGATVQWDRSGVAGADGSDAHVRRCANPTRNRHIGTEWIFARTASSVTSPTGSQLPDNSWGYDSPDGDASPSVSWQDKLPEPTTSKPKLWRAKRTLVCADNVVNAGDAVAGAWSAPETNIDWGHYVPQDGDVLEITTDRPYLLGGRIEPNAYGPFDDRIGGGWQDRYYIGPCASESWGWEAFAATTDGELYAQFEKPDGSPSAKERWNVRIEGRNPPNKRTARFECAEDGTVEFGGVR